MRLAIELSLLGDHFADKFVGNVFVQISRSSTLPAWQHGCTEGNWLIAFSPRAHLLADVDSIHLLPIVHPITRLSTTLPGCLGAAYMSRRHSEIFCREGEP